MRRFVFLLALCGLALPPAGAQPGPALYASGLLWPSGLTVDARGWVWAAEGGTGTAGTGRVSVVTPDGARHDFLTGLPSQRLPFIPYSARSVHFVGGQTLVVTGGGSDPRAAKVFAVDTTGWRPGDPPRTPADLTLVADVGAYVAAQGLGASNPADLAVGPDGAWYLTDQGANALLRYDPAGAAFSVVATFPPTPNPTPVGPPMIPASPIGIERTGDRFFVALQRGFPYLDGLSVVHEVTTAGVVTPYRSGLTNVVDVARHPADGSPVVASMGTFDPATSYLEDTGALLKLNGAATTTLADSLTTATALTYGPDGALFAAEIFSGNVYRLAPTPEPSGATLVATGLVNARGIATDAAGRVWVAETGSGADDGRISVVLPDGRVFPFLTGLDSEMGAEGPEGVNHLTLQGDDLWFTMSFHRTSGRLHRISTAGFTPGDPPRSPADLALTVDVGAFVLAQGRPETNPYGVAVGPDGALYVTDAAANALVRRAADGALSVLATFPDLPNPTPVGPPFVHVVPTGIVAGDGRLYVASLTGFPFVDGLARVYAVELDGAVTTHRDGLATLTDVARDPRDGALTALRFARFQLSPPPPGFVPFSGRAFRIDDDRVLAEGFNFAAGAAYDPSGQLYVATVPGELYRVGSYPVPAEAGPPPAAVALDAPRPNPSAGTTALGFTLAEATAVRLAVYDALGRRVAVIAEGERPAGHHAVTWEADGVAPGVYVVRLEAGATALARRVTRVR